MPSAAVLAVGLGQPAFARRPSSTARMRSSRRCRRRNSTASAPRARGHRVHVHLTRVVVGGRRQPTIRALPQWRIRRVERDALVGDVVRRADAGVAGVPVVELPGDHAARAIDGGLDVDHAGRAGSSAQVNSSARVHTSFTGLPAAFASRAASMAYSPRVLAAIARSHVGDDHADAILGDPKGARPARFGRRTAAACRSRR